MLDHQDIAEKQQWRYLPGSAFADHETLSS